MQEAFIISDLHLGSPACQAEQILAFLKEIHLHAKMLILNGDVFDSWDFRRLNKAHWKVLSEIRSLSNDMKIIWIVGNHDGPAEIITNLLGVDFAEQYTFKSGKKKILVLHGDRFDDFISKHPFITWISDWIYLAMQKIHIYGAKHIKKYSKTFLRVSEKVKSRAIKYGKKYNADIVCCGHTHHEMSSEGYYNSGAWTELPCSYLSVKDGEVKVCHFDKHATDLVAADSTGST
jgi:UDP-2,3-diacylglucosamine pyrophosphatase LpxH